VACDYAEILIEIFRILLVLSEDFRGTAAFCRPIRRFYLFHAFSLRVQYLQQLTDRRSEGRSRRFSTSRDDSAGNEFITAVVFVITTKTYSKLCSYGRTACTIALNTVRGGQTETQMLRQIRDVIRIENL